MILAPIEQGQKGLYIKIPVHASKSTAEHIVFNYC